MNKIFALILPILALLTSCRTLTVENKQYQKTYYQVTLGSLGNDKENVLGTSHSQSGEMDYVRLKVLAKSIPFNRTSYRAFAEAKSAQSAPLAVDYVDSLETKPTFLSLEIADRIGLVHMLNDKPNSDVREYLMNQNDTEIVTGLSIVFNEESMKSLIDAQELFLEPVGVDSYALKLYQNGALTKTLPFNEGVVFAYRTANCCWKQNDKYQLEIVDLVEGNEKCPHKSHLWSSRAKKKINYYKL